MMDPSTRLEHYRDLARRLGSAVAHRGAHQCFYAQPSLPDLPITMATLCQEWTALAARIQRGEASPAVSLYLHIPFCSRKCRYCHYVCFEGAKTIQVDRYLGRLFREMTIFGRALDGISLTSGYLGGGTPSLLSETQLLSLIDEIDRRFRRHPEGTWTCELDPLTASADKIAILADRGFRRLSLGVQSLDTRVLHNVRRGYQTEAMIAAVLSASQAKRLWINVDLLHGLPHDSVEGVIDSTRRLLQMGANHVTIYSLSPSTPERIARQRSAEPIPLAELKPRLEAALGGEDFGITVSIDATCLNVSCPGATGNRAVPLAAATSRTDNLTYSDRQEDRSLLGLGASAHSVIVGTLRYRLLERPLWGTFRPGQTVATGRRCAPLEEERRAMLLGLCSEDGLIDEHFQARFGMTAQEAFGAEIEALSQLKLIGNTEGTLRITTPDPLERFAAQMFFLDDARVEAAEHGLLSPVITPRKASTATRSPAASRGEARRRDTGPIPRVDLLLRGPRGTVVISLRHHSPSQPCYLSEGAWAFVIPSVPTVPPVAMEPERDALLQAFCGRFRRVISRYSPPTLSALAATLLPRDGRALRLQPRGPGPKGSSYRIDLLGPA